MGYGEIWRCFWLFVIVVQGSWRTVWATISFGISTQISPSLPGSKYVTAADLDGDGDMDVMAVGHLLQRAVWYENLDGSGTFSSGTELSFGGRAESVVAADVDGDGDMDVIVGGDVEDYISDGYITIFRNTDGLGTFDTGANITTPFLHFVNDMDVHDFDGDGDVDLLVADASYLRFFENDGTGTFSPAVNLASGSSIWHCAIGDLDGNGQVDILYSDSSAGSRVLWLAGDGTGSYTNPIQVAPSENTIRGFSVGDIDGDGDEDVVVGTNGYGVAGWVAWFENIDGDGSSWVGTNLTVSTESSFFTSVLADLDNDGDLDILVNRNGIDTTELYENLDGNGIFSTATSILTAQVDSPWGLFVADLDKDADLDLLVSSFTEDGVVWVENLLDSTTPTLTPSPSSISTPSPSTAQSLTMSPNPSTISPVPSPTKSITPSPTTAVTVPPLGISPSPTTTATAPPGKISARATPSSSGQNTVIVLGSSFGGAALVIMGVTALIVYRRQRKNKTQGTEDHPDLPPPSYEEFVVAQGGRKT